jgi:competence protein ComEA
VLAPPAPSAPGPRPARRGTAAGRSGAVRAGGGPGRAAARGGAGPAAEPGGPGSAAGSAGAGPVAGRAGAAAAPPEPAPLGGAGVGGRAADPPTVPLPAVALSVGPALPPPSRRVAGAVGRTGGTAPAEGLLWRWLPPSWRGARIDPGRRGAAALAVVAAAAAVLAALGVWSGRPHAEPVAALPAVTVSTAAPGGPPLPTSAAPGPAAPLTVSVAGAVVRPGLVEVPEGARVADVLKAAGGPLPDTDLTGINLARRVADGEQVAVGVPPAPDAVPGAGGGAPGGDAATGPAGGLVDLNRATEAELDALPGVGPVTAQRILQWRERNGRFRTVEQLREVEGIGERRLAQLRELVTV